MMSADNGIWVRRVAKRWYVWHGFSSDTYWYGNKRSVERYAQAHGRAFTSKTKAILAAHEMAKEYAVLEYGVQVIE